MHQKHDWTVISRSQLRFLVSLYRQGKSLPHAHVSSSPYEDDRGVVHKFNTVVGCKEKGWIDQDRHGTKNVEGRDIYIWVLSLTDSGRSVVSDILGIVGCSEVTSA